MNAIGTGFLEGGDSPIDRALHSRSSGHAATDFIGETAKIVFQRRRFQRFLNQLIVRVVSSE